MKIFKIFLMLATAVTLLSSAASVKKTYTMSKDYVVTINGTSNLHNWKEKVEIVTGSGVVNWNSDGSFDLETTSIKLNVHSIKSDMGAIMNNNTYKALKADANPEIIFSLTVPILSNPANSNKRSIAAKGNLTIAGVTRLVTMPVKLTMQSHEKLTLEGSQTIRMTDYKVTPPVALMGTMRTGDEITINFKINLQQAYNL